MEQLYIPYPDPRFPETMKQEYIQTLKAWGVITVDAWATREDYKREAGSYDTWPTEGQGNKQWCDTKAIVWGDQKRYIYYRLLRDDKGAPVRRPINFGDDMFYYLPPSIPQCFRSRPALFKEVPLLRRYEVRADEAGRLNFDGLPTDQVPVGRFMDNPDGEVGQGTAWPSNIAWRFRPGSDIVEFFQIEKFIAANPIEQTPPPAARKLTDAQLVATARDILTEQKPVADLAAALRKLAAA